jgi:phosphohistidine swiveling domain-containing protein
LKKKYFWLDQGYIGRGVTLKHIQEIRKHQISGNRPVISRKDLLKELNISPLEKKLLSVSADMVEIKSTRADVRQALHVVTNNIVDCLASRWRIQAKFLEVLSTEELISAIKSNGVTLDGLDSRWERSLIIPTSLNRYRILLGKDIDTFLNSRGIINRKIVKENLELKGQVAQMGKARGRVRLVFGPQHNNKVKKGDILVSISTSPQLLPAMKIASAFVTEVGGITSHAAIVARELRRPCIVGVKGVTQLLSDGDLVEVDADKGVVMIIK